MYTRHTEHASAQRRFSADASCTMSCTGFGTIISAVALLASALLFISTFIIPAICWLAVLLCGLGCRSEASASAYPVSFH
jgi:hypothetical protein